MQTNQPAQPGQPGQPAAPGAPAAAPAKKIYTAGALRYTTGGVVMLFIWLLWGDFCFSIFEEIFSKFLPLYMKELKASSTLTGVLTGSLGGIVNVLFMPGISMASDRHRGRRGRRIPFLLWSTPCAVGSLILIGFTSEIGGWLHALLGGASPGVTVAAVTITMLCVFVAMYHFFNMVLVNLYQCLLRDVVPPALMARFLALFRVVSTGGRFVFSWYVLPHVLTHREWVFAGVGVVYTAAFLLMCWRVREGGYPPPPEEKPPGYLSTYAVYFRECLTAPIYRNFIFMYACVTAASTCVSPFVILFASETLKLSPEAYGRTFAWGWLAAAFAYVPFGWLCDKVSPMRVAVGALAGLMVSWGIGYFVLQGGTSWLVYWIAVQMFPSTAWNLGFTAVTMMLFHQEKFAQLSSGLNVIGFGSSILGSFLIGLFIDLTGQDYRMIFAWSFCWFALAVVLMALVYRDWKRLGGPDHYAPPLPGKTAAA
ncbi:MAG: MFS transporter [Opitutaceae bacterium]|jgi:MFS family permease|nr:MFS transporter [Opitutaceae bacterium]